MHILSIDTTSHIGSVALLRDDQVFAAVSSTGDGPHSQRLYAAVDRVLREAGVPPPQVDVYAVATGPGSFTGVRVGITAVKAWAEVYLKPVAAVSALEAIAVQATPGEPLVAGVADARRGQFFAGLYERDGDALRRRGDDVVLPPAECLNYLRQQAAGAPIVIRTTAFDAVRGAFEDAALRVEAADPALAPFIGRLGFRQAQQRRLTDALSLDAHYVRRSDAELLWKETR